MLVKISIKALLIAGAFGNKSNATNIEGAADDLLCEAAKESETKLVKLTGSDGSCVIDGPFQEGKNRKLGLWDHRSYETIAWKKYTSVCLKICGGCPPT
jgi:hypothetical protein